MIPTLFAFAAFAFAIALFSAQAALVVITMIEGGVNERS